jgi:hypothetical protein
LLTADRGQVRAPRFASPSALDGTPGRFEIQ